MSIDKVWDEIKVKEDMLKEWVKKNFSLYFVSTNDEETQEIYSEIANWLIKTNYKKPAKDEFLNGADPWLIAAAKSKGHVVVTLEHKNDTIRKEVPIPNVCEKFGVHYMDLFQMLKELDGFGSHIQGDKH